MTKSNCGETATASNLLQKHDGSHKKGSRNLYRHKLLGQPLRYSSQRLGAAVELMHILKPLPCLTAAITRYQSTCVAASRLHTQQMTLSSLQLQVATDGTHTRHHRESR